VDMGQRDGDRSPASLIVWHIFKHRVDINIYLQNTNRQTKRLSAGKTSVKLL